MTRVMSLGYQFGVPALYALAAVEGWGVEHRHGAARRSADWQPASGRAVLPGQMVANGTIKLYDHLPRVGGVVGGYIESVGCRLRVGVVAPLLVVSVVVVGLWSG